LTSESSGSLPNSFWPRVKTWYEKTFRFNQAQRDSWVAACARQIPPGSRVLDVGAGEARYRRLFAHCDYRTQDFGLEPGTIGRYTDLDYKSDVLDIPVPDGSFDVILCTEVLEHVPDPIRAVGEFSRILRKGGTLYLSAPLGALLHQEPYHFYGGYTPHWYRRFLPMVGFDIVRLERNGGFFRFVGQETLRFSALLDPRRAFRLGPARGAGVSMLWLLTLPVTRLLIPLLASWLDDLKLEAMATVGYHVVAVRR
jgi:SAM-dependent methyltransferase